MQVIGERGVLSNKTSIFETESMAPEASIHKATHYSKGNADNVCDPVDHIGAAVKSRLDEFNETAKGTRPHNYREQSKAACSGEGEGERRKGNEMYDLIATVQCWRWSV